MVHQFFKKQDIIEFCIHESELLDNNSFQDLMATFRSPLALVKEFAASGAGGLVAAFLGEAVVGTGAEGMENLFAAQVAARRDACAAGDAKKNSID